MPREPQWSTDNREEEHSHQLVRLKGRRSTVASDRDWCDQCLGDLHKNVEILYEERSCLFNCCLFGLSTS